MMCSVSPLLTAASVSVKSSTIFDFQLKANLIVFLERDIETAGIENLAQLHMHGAQNLILIEMGTDRLSDFCEQLVLFGAALGRRASQHISSVKAICKVSPIRRRRLDEPNMRLSAWGTELRQNYARVFAG